jgi:divalent metal cation (Fe/Co/Zn/Cd) transporter
VLENVGMLIGRSTPATLVPAEYLTKQTHLIWKHHEEIRHIDTMRAYTFGVHYFVEVDLVLPGDMPLNKAHEHRGGAAGEARASSGGTSFLSEVF